VSRSKNKVESRCAATIRVKRKEEEEEEEEEEEDGMR